MTTSSAQISASQQRMHDERSRRTAALFEAAAAATDDGRRQECLDEVVRLNMRVAHALARRFSRRGIDADDLVQVACVGLVKAASRFDPAVGGDFLSFAVPTIRGELQRHFRDAGWVVRPTRRIQETRWQVNRTTAQLTQRLGRTPDAREVMDELDLTHEQYAEAVSADGCFRPTSLDQPVTLEDDGASLGDLLPDEERDTAASEARLMLAPLVRTLSERDRRVLYLRFFEDLGQREIGAELGVTQTQVSRILDRILVALRAGLTCAPAEGALSTAA